MNKSLCRFLVQLLLFVGVDPYPLDLLDSFSKEIFLDPLLDLDYIGHDLPVLHAGFPAGNAKPAHKHVGGAGKVFPKKFLSGGKLPYSDHLRGVGQVFSLGVGGESNLLFPCK